MNKTWFKIFMSLFVLLFASVWIAGSVAEARSRDTRRRGHHRHHRPVASYNVGGIVNELAGGETIVLLNNGRDDLEITANGDFTFSTTFADGETYDVTILTQPDSQFCQVNNGSGTINGADVTDITIICSDFSYFSASAIAGGTYTVAVKTDGTVWMWGTVGELGAEICGYYRIPCSPTPVQVGGLMDVTAIAVGIALKSDGTVWALGSHGADQLGDWPKTGSSTTPVKVRGLTDVTAIATGTHALALKTDGTVWAWGSNSDGQLGDGTTTYSYTPVQVSGLTDVTAIAAGTWYALALKTDGTVWAWGSNWSGQLGTTTTETCDSNPCSRTPVQVSGLTDVTIIAAGSSHALAVKTDGTVWAWGDNEHGQLGVETTETCRNESCSTTPVQISSITDVADVAAGWTHTLALKADGTVWAWGWNYYGQLGDGSTIKSTTPVQVSGLTDVTAIAAGYGYTVALKTNGTVWSWGDNEYGKLGDGSTINSTTPVPVEALDTVYTVGGTVENLAEGETLALQNNGGDDLEITANGDFNFYTPLVDGAAYDVKVLTQPDSQYCFVSKGSEEIRGDVSVVCFDLFRAAATIAGGERHTIALKTDGTVWAWGWNKFGQLGDGTTTDSSTPVQVSGLTDVTAIAAGDWHTVALKTDGTVWAWGQNSQGQLGTETTETCSPSSPFSCSTTPVQVSGLTDITAIAAGVYHTLALKTDGTVWAWGLNHSGQLGDGTTTNSTTPVQVASLTNVTAIAAGGSSHTLALKTDGTVWAWGSNQYGQLWTTTETCDLSPCSTTPVQLPGLTDVTAIATGDSHAIAVKTDGTVWAWGSNATGQLGNGTTTDSSTPVQVSKLTDVTAIAARGYSSGHTIALKTDGTVWAWGSNATGQLGNGTTTDSSTPVQVSELTDVTAIAAGGDRSGHTIAVKIDGTVWTWGSDSSGQLGTTTSTNCSILGGEGTIDYYSCSTTPMPVVEAILPPPGATYSLGGTVSGLADGGTLELEFSIEYQYPDGSMVIGDGLVVLTENGPFALGKFKNGSIYGMSVWTDGQTCTITNGNGTINGADVTNIMIDCEGVLP